jgi:hypothetical protein
MEQQQWSAVPLRLPLGSLAPMDAESCVQMPLSVGPNDGGIKRGDRTDTGDDEARPTDNGGGGEWIEDADDLGVTNDLPDVPYETDVEDLPVSPDLEDATILDAEDPRLGLTNTATVPADDWAADTGPTRTPE